MKSDALSHLLYMLLLLIAYPQITEKSFLGFDIKTEYLIVDYMWLALCPINILLTSLIWSLPAKIIFSSMTYFYIIPSFVVHFYSPMIGEAQIISIIIFNLIIFLMFFLLQNYKLGLHLNLNKKSIFIFILLMLVSLIIFRDNINLLNIVLSVYEVRVQDAYKDGTRFAGYLYGYLTRFLLVILFLYAYIKKNFFLLTFGLACLIAFYTIGAVKSVVVGVALSLFFASNKTHVQALQRLNKFFVILVLSAIAEDLFFESYLLHDYFVRRVLLFPPVLASYFFDFFDQNYLYFAQITGAETIIPDGMSVSQFIGTYHMPYFTDPSVGIIVDGFVNAGFAGVIAISICWGIALSILIFSGLPPYYTGLLLYIIYLGNTAFFSTLMLTHGLFLGLISLAFMKITITSQN